MRSAPPRPDESPAQRRPERRWTPMLAVLAVIVTVTGGSQVVGDAVARRTEPIVVGAVTATPRPGWELVSTDEDEGATSALLRRGSAGLFVVSFERGLPTEDLAEGYAQALGDRFAQLTIGEPGVDDHGRVRFSYVGRTDDGVAVEGVVIVVAAPSGSGVVFDGFAPMGSLGAVASDLATMVDTAQVR